MSAAGMHMCAEGWVASPGRQLLEDVRGYTRV